MQQRLRGPHARTLYGARLHRLRELPRPTPAQPAATQIKLTEQQVEGFIAAQKDMSAVVEKIQGPIRRTSRLLQFKAELEAVTKKHGFKDFDDYDAVAANITMVMTGDRPEDQGLHRSRDGDQERDRTM